MFFPQTLLFVQLSAFTKPPAVPLKSLPRRPALQILFKPDDDPQHQREHQEQQRQQQQQHQQALSSKEGFTTTGSAISISSSTLPSTRVIPSSTSRISTNSHNDLLPDSFAPLLSSSQTELIWNQLTPDLLHGLQVRASVSFKEGTYVIPLQRPGPPRPQLTLSNSSGCALSCRLDVGSGNGFSLDDDLNVQKSTTDRSWTMVKHGELNLSPAMALSNVAPTLLHLPTLFEDTSTKWLTALMRFPNENDNPDDAATHTDASYLRKSKHAGIFAFFIVKYIAFARLLVMSLSSLIERLLWWIESKCQVHLSKVRILPKYRHVVAESLFENSDDELSNCWRLQLSFSGYVMLWNWIPIPFINISLPTFIIPAPHAFLTYLLSPQPLASATMRHENIPHEDIAMALMDICESWNLDLQAAATPPALSVDVTLPGGMTVAVETMLGKDLGSQPAATTTPTTPAQMKADDMPFVHHYDGHSVSTWGDDPSAPVAAAMSFGEARGASLPNSAFFDANRVVPWLLEASLQGTLDRDRVSLNISNVTASHSMPDKMGNVQKSCHLSLSGSCVIQRADPAVLQSDAALYYPELENSRVSSSPNLSNIKMIPHRDKPSVAATLAFPDLVAASSKAERLKQLLQYEYSFDIPETTNLDSVSVSVGVTHPMLKGATLVTTVLESVYAFGTLTSRKGSSILNPFAPTRKRNLLRHIPSTDFTVGILNAYIPQQISSYIDDGNSIILPEMRGGKITVRALGGISTQLQGIKFIADFGIGLFGLKSETKVNEFPELEIYDGVKLLSSSSGQCQGRIIVHLRPHSVFGEQDGAHYHTFHHQNNTEDHINEYDHHTYDQFIYHHQKISLMDRHNLLDSYEIGFSGSYVSLKLKEMVSTLGHRRLIIPSESTIQIKVIESVVNMAFEGKTKCEFSWDFQGLSPILQVAPLGIDPGEASHEERRQCPLLISPLRQGRLNFNVSSVGAISITQAATSRESRQGLYDWKFINALISPDDESPKRLIDVLHDKRSMKKLLQVVDLLNNDLYKFLDYLLTQVWRAHEIFEQEGITDAAHVIPGHKMARLISLFLCGDLKLIDNILPIIKRVIAGNGLDVIKVKELLHQNVKAYEEWAPEIDRVIRIASVLLGPISCELPAVENHVIPLSEIPEHSAKFVGIPSAKLLYANLHEQQHLPLDPSFSNLLGRLAPYMTFVQVDYILKTRPRQRDWQPEDLRRLRYVYAVKRKALEISESYGGISFMPQSFFVSVFLGEATRASLRSRSHGDNIQKLYFPQKGDRKNESMLTSLRKQRGFPSKQHSPGVDESQSVMLSPAGRIASVSDLLVSSRMQHQDTDDSYLNKPLFDLDEVENSTFFVGAEPYELGDSLLGPQDVAVLLQAGLTSSMKGSTVVQLNQRMLLDLIASQPKSFAVAVLAEIGTPGGHGSPRSLTSSLIAILDLDQSSFLPAHRLDMKKLLESWLTGVKIPHRTDYLAGGRWARQSYYDAIYAVAKSILDDAETYMALKGHIQRVRHGTETDPIPRSKEEELAHRSHELADDSVDDLTGAKFLNTVKEAKRAIEEADSEGYKILQSLREAKLDSNSSQSKEVVALYRNAFDACARVLKSDKLAIQTSWFKSFFRRNYDALMIKSVYENAVDDIEEVRKWLNSLLLHACTGDPDADMSEAAIKPEVDFFNKSAEEKEQKVIDAIIDCLFFDSGERQSLRNDPLVRLLISNPSGHYNFTIVSAMGVVTEGKKGLELESSFQRLLEMRGVETIRADTGTARSFEFNASKIEDAIKIAYTRRKPFGLLGYSQGCANSLTSESNFVSGE